MKFDELNCLIREKYPEGHIANLGDSAAETCRCAILGSRNLRNGTFIGVDQFIELYDQGYVRHPDLRNVPGWDSRDFSNDQLLPLAIVAEAYSARTDIIAKMREKNWFFILGTRKPLSIGCWALFQEWYWLLNLSNIVQGWLLALPFRIGDGFKIERSKDQVQDYLNLICIYVFLKRIGRWATLPRPADECLAAVRRYYLEGDDKEPNSEWLVELYAKNLLGDSNGIKTRPSA